MLLSKTVKVKWCSRNIKWYESRGYKFTHKGDEFEVKVEDLSKYSNVKVKVKYDCLNCNKLEPHLVTWQNYIKYVKEDDKYYCSKCAINLFGKEKLMKTKLKNSKSFEQWCYDNLNEEKANEILSRWDYELNKCNPSEISYGTKKKYYFKCLKHSKHKSELKCINSFTSGQEGSISCNQCNSFEQWCIKNNRQDILGRWDYELNDCKPNEIAYSTHSEYYFKCPMGIHESILQQIDKITTKKSLIKCHQCNSFAQWGIDNLGEGFLEKYWDYEKNKNINPWEISHASPKTKVYIKCQEKDYHGSYKITCNDFINGYRCCYCNSNSGKVHPLDSLGQYIIDNFGQDFLNKVWSDRNKKSAFEYAPRASKKVWWRCPDGKHEDFKRVVNASYVFDFRCPSCNFSKGEKRIEDYLMDNKINYIPQKEFDGLVGLGNGNLSYDFYLPNYNLLIEYQGEFHKQGTVSNQTKKQFKKQQEHDRRKKQYAIDNNIKLLEIWYWDYDNVEEILKKELIN